MVKSLSVRALWALVSALHGVSAMATPIQSVNYRSNQPLWPYDLADQVFGPSWPDFADETSRWSTYRAPSFDEVFFPSTEEELADGISFLTSHNLSFLAKSGGHGYSITLESVQDSVLINMEQFNYATINDDMTVTIGSGVTFGALVEAVAGAGREIPTGSCACVGATGAMLGGGIGRLQGLHGLTADTVQRVRLALWNGTIVEASNDVNQDLFWGLRGGGQNFGVVFETTLETYPGTNGGQVYEAILTFTVDKLETVVNGMNSLMPLDAALALIMIVSTDPSSSLPFILLEVVYHGPETQGREYAQRFGNYSLSFTDTMMPWGDLPAQAGGGAFIAQCAKGRRQDMYGVSTETLNAASFVDMLNEYLALVEAHPGAASSAIMIEQFAQQGIDQYPDDFNAFPHRGQFNNFVEIIGQWDDDSVADATNAWAKKWRDHFAEPSISGYDHMVVYQNYAHGDEPLSVLYGREQWRQEKLTALKNAYDPHGFFDAYHAIPRRISEWT